MVAERGEQQEERLLVEEFALPEVAAIANGGTLVTPTLLLNNPKEKDLIRT